MAQYKWDNTDRALAYGHSELGEVMILNESAGTISSVKAVNGATVQAPGTTKAQAKSHVAVIHPGITSIVG